MAKKVAKEIKYRCRDCKHSFDRHEKSIDTGLPFMCRCPFEKWAKFLSDPACDKFEMRKK